MAADNSEHSEQVIHLGEPNSIANIYLNELRNVSVQNDRMRFRMNMSRLGQIAAYEISKLFNYKEQVITTPLSESIALELVDQPIIATILRAGLPLFEGMLSVFDRADSAFISAYRKHDQIDGFEIAMNSISCPSIDDRVVIICDPMLATGQSLVTTLQELDQLGKPIQYIVVTVVASEEGLAYFQSKFPEALIYTFAIDPQLNSKSYIVPGLGDAGDLSFGPKIQE